ncbi:MAG: DUF4157 domain-containing protein [Candidatus Thiodiazotropha sp.]
MNNSVKSATPARVNETVRVGNYRVSQPGDRLELEADRVANEVLRMPEPVGVDGTAGLEAPAHKCSACAAGNRPCPLCSQSGGSISLSRSFEPLLRQPVEEVEEELQRQSLEDEEELQRKSSEDEEELQRQPLEDEEELQRQAVAGDEEELQRQASEEEEELQLAPNSDKISRQTDGAQMAAQSVRTGGVPLPDRARDYFEPRFGTDLGDVRVHTGEAAAKATAAVSARAFTLGNAIAFAPGQFNPAAASGRRLLAHELAHVMQQTGAANAKANSAPMLARETTAPILQREEEASERSADNPNLAAEQIHDALDGWNDEAAAVRPLRGNSEAENQAIRTAFQERYQIDLRQYFNSQLAGDWQVKAHAILKDGHEHGMQTAVGLALIPMGTRDEELNRVIYNLPLSGRKEMERRYNETFGIESGYYWIGHGNLEADFIYDLSGWQLEKYSALMDRDLTAADKLYFDSVGIVGTKDDSVIKQIQDAWDKGPAEIAKLETEWGRYVSDTSGWTSGFRPIKPWTQMNLQDAMASELSGASWEMVDAVFKGYETYKEEVAGSGSGGSNETAGGEAIQSEEQIKALEDIQLQIAQDTLDAATTGGFTGLGTDEAQVNRAIDKIRKVWEGRIAREAKYQAAWDQKREEINTLVLSEMSVGSADQVRARLTMLGDLTLADKVYIAGELDLDNNKALSLVDQAWQQNKIDELLAQAEIPRRDSDDESVVLRPAYYLYLVIPVTSGTPSERLRALIDKERPQPERGADRIKVELSEGSDESDLVRAYNLIKGAPTQLQSDSIATFVRKYGSVWPELGSASGDANARFVSFVFARYSSSFSCYSFQNLLQPTSDPEEIARRAREQQRSEESILTPVIDLVTGEDTGAVTEESADRLEFIAQASEAELQLLMAMTGTNSREELAKVEKRLFDQRVAEMRALRNSVADSLALAIEIAAELALTAVTGGGAGGLLVASLGAAIAGMVAREIAMGEDYDFFDEKNLAQLVTIAATAGIGKVAKPLGEAVGGVAEMMKLGDNAQAFLRGAVEEGFTQVNQELIKAGVENKMPTTEQLTAQAVTLLSKSASKGRADAYLAEHGETLRTRLEAAVQQELIGGLAQETSSMAATGIGNLTATDIAERYLKRVGTSVRDAAKNATRDEIAARARARSEEEEARRQVDGEVTRTGSAVFDHEGVEIIPSLRALVHRPVGDPIGSDEASAQNLLRRIANGDASALVQLGITDVPEGYDPRTREWGLGRTSSGEFVLVQGARSFVSWSGLPDIDPVGHSHPMIPEIELPGGGVSVEEILHPDANEDLGMKLMPSGADISTVADRGVSVHEVHTPFVDLGGGRVGNPSDATADSTGVTIVIANAKQIGNRNRNVIYTAYLLIQNEHGNVLKVKQVWAEKLVSVGESVIYWDGPPPNWSPQEGDTF